MLTEKSIIYHHFFLSTFLILLVLISGCKTLPKDHYRGTLWQRYTESPDEVLSALKKVLKEERNSMWEIRSIADKKGEIKLKADYSPEEPNNHFGSRGIVVRIRRDYGTLITIGNYKGGSPIFIKEKVKFLIDRLNQHYLSAITLDEYLAKRGEDEEDNILDDSGFFANAEAGMSSRFNLSYGRLGKIHSVANLYGEIGLLNNLPLVEADYEWTFPKNQFQQDALEYNKDVSFGLEKYTFGVDLAPLWMIVFNEDTPWLVERLLSLRFRTVRELTQTTRNNEAFNIEYKYDSATFPLLLYNKKGYFASLNVGLGQWSISRTSYGYLETTALITAMRIHTKIPNEPTLSSAGGETIQAKDFMGFRFDVIYGYGIYRELGEGMDVEAHSYDFKISYPIVLFEKSDILGGKLRYGLKSNTFTTGESTDYIITPWVRLTMSFH